MLIKRYFSPHSHLSTTFKEFFLIQIFSEKYNLRLDYLFIFHFFICNLDMNLNLPISAHFRLVYENFLTIWGNVELHSALTWMYSHSLKVNKSIINLFLKNEFKSWCFDYSRTSISILSLVPQESIFLHYVTLNSSIWFYKWQPVLGRY